MIAPPTAAKLAVMPDQSSGAGPQGVKDMFTQALEAVAALPSASLPAAPLAQVFNQEGFFGHACSSAREAVTLPAGVTVAIDRPDEGVPAILVDANPGRSAAPHGGIAGELDKAAVAPFRTDSAPRASRDDRSDHVPIFDQAASPSAPESEEEQLGAQVLRREFRRVTADRSPMHVAIREVEQGVQVAAHVGSLSDTERRHLRDAIAALLARHGLSPSQILIVAAPVGEMKR
jgi:hypothetical protein